MPVDSTHGCCEWSMDSNDPLIVWPGTDAWKDFGGNPDLVVP
jgi:hypothetical protein